MEIINKIEHTHDNEIKEAMNSQKNRWETK
jgi:hypothetical protein